LTPLVDRELLDGLGRYAQPEGPLETRLAAWWSEAIGVDQLGAEDDFFDLGGTSTQAAAIFSRIAAELRVKLPLASLYETPTLRALAREIAHRQAESQPARSATGRLVAIQASGASQPLFVVPGIGGGVVGLAHLARALGPAYPVYAFESRGLGDGEIPLTDLRQIAAEYVADLRRFQPDGPHQLFGVCWGGMVVLEMARQLAAAGAAPSVAILLDPPPFGVAGGEPARRAFAMPRFVGSRLRMYWDELRALPGDQRREYLRRRLGLIADIVRHRDLFRGDDSEFRRRKVREANLVAARTYRPAPPQTPVDLMFTGSRPGGRSRSGRERWIALLASPREPVHVPGRDTGDAISSSFARHVAEALRPRLS
jgi:thioesterase domain-containing protein/acyl carrier protein